MKLINPPKSMPKKLIKSIERTKSFTFDLEARSMTGKQADAKVAALAMPTILAISSGSFDKAYLWDDDAEEMLVYLLKTEGIEAIAHNVLYDFVVLHKRDIIDIDDVRATIRDTMVLQFMVDENIPKGLKSLVELHLGYKMKTYNETTRDNPKNVRLREIKKEVKAWDRVINNFGNSRPWPNFDSTTLQRRTKLKKSVDRASEVKWPPSITTAASGSQTKRWNKEDREARAHWRSERHTYIEDAFGLGNQLMYQQFLDSTVLCELAEESKILEHGLVVDELVYAEDDARQTKRLHEKLSKKVARMGDIVQAWYEIESEVRVVTLKMSCNGIHVDKEEALRQQQGVEPVIEQLYGEVQNLCRGWLNDKDEEFNPGSSKQVRQVLFEHLKIKVPHFRYHNGVPLAKLTDAGEDYCREHRVVFDLNRPDALPQEFWDSFISVDSEVLERIPHPMGMAILNYRVAKKLKTTYMDKLVSLPGSRVYSLFSSIATKTGRLASSQENLQNIPSRKKPSNYDKKVQSIGPALRVCYIAPPGKKMIVADQSQIELRIITHLTKDPVLREVYTSCVVIDGISHYTGDIHAATGKALSIPRKDSKSVNFGLTYEMKAPRFARMNRMFTETGEYDIATASIWREGFYDTYQGLRAYLDTLTTYWNAGKTDYKMLTDRVRRFPKDAYTTGGKILNSKVQGSSADLLKLAMLAIDRFVCPHIPSLKLIFQVHDELGYEVDEEQAELAGILVKFAMEHDWIGTLTLPVLASAKVCHSWAAKDDDNLPEIGIYYARIDGEDLTFDATTWHEMVAADNAGKIEQKGAAAMLTAEQLAICKQYFPESIHGESPWLTTTTQ